MAAQAPAVASRGVPFRLNLSLASGGFRSQQSRPVVALPPPPPTLVRDLGPWERDGVHGGESCSSVLCVGPAASLATHQPKAPRARLARINTDVDSSRVHARACAASFARSASVVCTARANAQRERERRSMQERAHGRSVSQALVRLLVRLLAQLNGNKSEKRDD
jgi:hypothetical protein